MKPETIKAIFTNLLFVIGVLLTIYGFSRGTLTVSRLLIFQKYPLYSYEETRCQYENFSALQIPVKDDMGTAILSEEEIKDRTDKCLLSLEQERQNRVVEDITNSLTALVAGIALSYGFRKYILK